MKPPDPRLARYARSARAYIVLHAVLGVVAAAVLVAQALLIAHVLATYASGDVLAAGDLGWSLGGIGATALARATISWASERFAHRSATRVIAELRQQVLDHAVRLGPRWMASGQAAPLAGLLTRGLDALDAYFVSYLPQFLLVATCTPLLVVVVGLLDLTSGLIVLLTVPLIPFFMILIGKLTATVAARRLGHMTRLGAQVLDLLAGLPTLKALGRERGPEQRVRQLSQAHQRSTFATIRIAFASGAVLELVATLSVAIVAVSIGLRLVFGGMDLAPGLAVLILAPEAYQPLRRLGTHFHASANGVAAAEAAFEVLETPIPVPGTEPAPGLADATIAIEDLGVLTPGGERWAPSGLELTLRPGQLTALTGPNGVGKTTAIGVLLGLIRPDRGRVVIRTPGGEHDLADIDPKTWWDQVAWAPQRPMILPGTVWENLSGRFGGQPTEAELAQAADAALAAGFDTVLAGLAEGWSTRIGHGGVGLSVGQRQRLALARVFMRDAPLVILDEPTAHLDAATERTVLDSITDLARRGRTVLVIAHRAELIAQANVTVRLDQPQSADQATGPLANPMDLPL